MATILWAYTRNNAFKKDGVDYHTSADLTGQANHLAVTMQADIVKQKQATNNGGYNGDQLRQDPQPGLRRAGGRPPDRLNRWQVANCFMGARRPDQLGRRVQGAGRSGARRCARR